MKLLGISGTIVGRKTRVIVDEVLDAVRKVDSNIEIEVLDLKDFDLPFCDGRDPALYDGDARKVIDQIMDADFILLGTPIFQASIPGTLKNLFDLVPMEAFHNKVMGFIATGGTYQHYLVVENQLKPIAGYFRAFTTPDYVYIHDDHFNELREIVDPDIKDRIEKLAKELIFMQRRLKDSN